MMPESLRWVAPALALAALALAVRAQYVARKQRVSLPSVAPTILICLAIIIGSLPGALDVQNSAVRTATIVVSLAMSVLALVMLLRKRPARTNNS